MPKLTFSLDEETVIALRAAARRSGKPQSVIVREAIAHHTAREAQLTPDEKARLLTVLRRAAGRRTSRSAAAVDAELVEIRRSRRAGWSRATK